MKSEAHIKLIEKAKEVGVICPEKFKSQKDLRTAIERARRANERHEARAEVSRNVIPW